MRLPVVALLLASCSNPPVEPPRAAPVVELSPPPSPTATAVAPAASVRAASGEPQYPLAPPELLARLDAQQRTDLAVLATICQPAVAEKKGALVTGCTACPSRGKPAGEPGARLVLEDVLIEPLGHVRGAFTEKGADEHLVTMDSCSCNGCLDEAYVVRAQAADSFVLHRLGDVRSSGHCKLVRRRGQVDRALCDRTIMKLGYVATALELHDFSSLAEGRREELTPAFEFDAVDDLVFRCGLGAHFVRRSLTRWELRDVDKDGVEDLVVELEVGDGVVTKEMVPACEPVEEGVPTQQGRLPPTRTVKLTWIATPGGFKPDAATTAQLKKLAAAKKKEDAEQ